MNKNISLNEILDLLEKAPYVTKNMEHYERFQNLHKALAECDAENYPNLCNGKVTGVWYLPGLTFDIENNPQVIVRSSEPLETMERLYRNAQICDIICNDIVYDYHRDIIGGDTMIKGQQRELFSEIAEGRVYTIYNNNHQEIKI